eukprot:SRR837773.10350.p1 GENE.SRR837773.10350~~SRR837773.10350.p1  ORF type:complete len:175 (+),score=11.87 SRR837773.10350:72-527(+)
MNQLLKPVGAGLFHCGVEIYGLEWSYGCGRLGIPEWHPVYGDTPESSGVYKYMPRDCDDHYFVESFDLGRTDRLQGVVLRHLRAMRHEWLADEYDVLDHNCCHFAVELCWRLGAAQLPEKILRLPRCGKACHDTISCKVLPCIPAPDSASR